MSTMVHKYKNGREEQERRYALSVAGVHRLWEKARSPSTASLARGGRLLTNCFILGETGASTNLLPLPENSSEPVIQGQGGDAPKGQFNTSASLQDNHQRQKPGSPTATLDSGAEPKSAPCRSPHRPGEGQAYAEYCQEGR